MTIEQRIKAIDWARFVGPEGYDPALAASTLCKLANADQLVEPESIVSKALFALGNNHRGTYYPAVLDALEIIIDISDNQDNQTSAICAKLILNELYYFEPDTQNCRLISDIELEAFVQEKLNPFSDESLDWKALKAALKIIHP